MLHYKTMDGSGPAGKPWVFFCAETEELPALLGEISPELFRICHCAIWYDDGRDTDPAIFEDALAQTGVAVLPVTPALLDPHGVLQQQVLPQVRAHGLSLLPLLDDPNLLYAFNAQFPQIQVLNRHDTDRSALPYEEKLARFLEPILLGDHLAQQVAGAFRARAFLSYRKQDRAQVLDLVRRIQDQPACRGIGIWYDEFLTPGEAFDEALAQTIRGSDLFLLALTKSMIREPNYVTRQEYPLAQQTGKPILPMAVEAVDPAGLAQSFPNLPPVLSFADLTDRLSDLAGPVETTPEQDMLLALAYLHGFHVVRRVSVGLELLEQSARRGHAPAALRLATLQILEQSPEAQLAHRQKWLRVYADAARQDFSRCPGKENARRLADALSRLGDVEFSENREEAAAMYREAISLMEKTGLPGEAAQLSSNYGVQLMRLGYSRDALAWLRYARKCWTEAGAEVLSLACCDYNVGLCALHLGELGLAGQATSSAIQLLTPLAQADRKTHSLMLAQSYGHLARIYRQMSQQSGSQKDLQLAHRCSEMALKLLTPAVDWDPPVYEPVFATECAAMATLLIQMGVPDRAQAHLDLAITIFRAYEGEYPGLYRRNLAETLGIRGNLLMAQKKFSPARKDYEAAEGFFRSMAGQEDNWALCLWNLANAHASEGQYDAARVCYEQATAIYDSGRIQGAAGSPNHAYCCRNYGYLLARIKDYGAARRWLRRALELFQGLARRTPGAYGDQIAELTALLKSLEQIL